jgi:hypothetical protein
VSFAHIPNELSNNTNTSTSNGQLSNSTSNARSSATPSPQNLEKFINTPSHIETTFLQSKQQLNQNLQYNQNIIQIQQNQSNLPPTHQNHPIQLNTLSYNENSNNNNNNPNYNDNSSNPINTLPNQLPPLTSNIPTPLHTLPNSSQSQTNRISIPHVQPPFVPNVDFFTNNHNNHVFIPNVDGFGTPTSTPKSIPKIKTPTKLQLNGFNPQNQQRGQNLVGVQQNCSFQQKETNVQNVQNVQHVQKDGENHRSSRQANVD